VEAQRELLVNGAVGVEKNMGGIAVDIGQPGERDGHSQLLGDLADHRLGGGFADLDVLPRTDMATSTMASSAYCLPQSGALAGDSEIGASPRCTTSSSPATPPPQPGTGD
jgi:hypothetical protein